MSRWWLRCALGTGVLAACFIVWGMIMVPWRTMGEPYRRSPSVVGQACTIEQLQESWDFGFSTGTKVGYAKGFVDAMGALR